MTENFTSRGLGLTCQFETARSSSATTGGYTSCCDCSHRLYRRPGVASIKKRCDDCADVQRRRVRSRSQQRAREKTPNVGDVAASPDQGATIAATEVTSARVANAGAGERSPLCEEVAP